jgi:hypothetical protein
MAVDPIENGHRFFDWVPLHFDIPSDAIQRISSLSIFALGMAAATWQLATVYLKIAHVHLGMGDCRRVRLRNLAKPTAE